MSIITLFVLINTILSKNAFGYLDIKNLTHNHVFDLQLYKDVLDPVLCQEQLSYLRNNDTILLAAFLDAGIRIPKGIFSGNIHDMGNYYECLGIKEITPNSVIEGKYCSINVQWDFLHALPIFVDPSDLLLRNIELAFPSENSILKRLQILQDPKDFDSNPNIVSKFASKSQFKGLYLRQAICLPKVCTTSEAINGLLLNGTPINFAFQEEFCRLPNDKPWVPADYVAMVIFSLIGLLSILSTSYEVYHSVLLKTDPQRINRILVIFSVYTNTRRLVTYQPDPGTLECLDGIRVLAMLWVVLGHSFAFQFKDFLINPVYKLEWLTSWKSIWVTAAPITVDTFFTISGLLLVYTTAGRYTGLGLIKNLHLFYLNRLLRMFPILATFILAQASFLNHVADGPYWQTMVTQTHRCRVYWWSTLLYINNYFHYENSCLPHTWYLAIDMQLYFISPIVLFWVLSGRKRYSWIALLVALSCAIISASVYSIIKKLPSGPVIPSRLNDVYSYMIYYYVNTLTRSPPFFIGMIYGYILHLNRNKNVMLPKLQVAILWICAIAIMSTAVFSAYPTFQLDWDNQTVDTLINCLMKPAWALAIGWLVFACTHGYSGSINWFLSLRMWKIPSRLSYAIYIVHFPLLFVVLSTPVTPVYFTVAFFMKTFIYILVLTMIISFIVMVLIDAPFSVLIKHFMRTGLKKPPNQSMQNELPRTQSISGTINKAFVPDNLKC